MQATNGSPDNPVLVRLWRGRAVESQHRGAWCLTNGRGEVLDGQGDCRWPVFTRSSVKSLQALPLLETGAAEHFGLTEAELALAISSHNAEAAHTEIVAGLLQRLGLSAADLQCGPQPPGDPKARARLLERGEKPTSLHNNCSGKHAGFLALALHLGVEPARYLDPESAGQRLVRDAVLAMSGVRADELSIAIDGCSAPTFRMPLAGLATAFARMATPDDLAGARRDACQRIVGAAAAHPGLIAGEHQRLCTDIARASRGRLFPKIGAEGVYAIGVRGGDRGLAVKVDDGGARALHALVVTLLERLGLDAASEAAALEPWIERRLTNWAGLEVGRTEVLVRAKG